MSSVLVATREFIRSRAERRLIEVPLNLNSRSLSVSAPLQEVVTFTNEQVQQYLDAASERMRLFLLLMLNCGMYSVDIGSLRQDEVDWQNGRIVRQRTKTKGMSKNVPKVDYLDGRTANAARI